MRKFFPARPLLPLLAAVLLVSGCAEMKNKVMGKEVGQCPTIRILADAAHQTKFKPGPGRDITDILYTLDLVDYQGSCGWRDKDTHIETAIKVMFDIDRGPANLQGLGEILYFVAVENRAKQIFSTKFKFDPSMPKLRQVDEEVSIDIPIRPGDTPYNTVIWLGLQLSPDELDYNRRTRK
ncbi:MAG: hypothetical protein HQL45_02315 [Alphaproteobacteria bacterium]|nr:hypothetical protein [Alphaproteobacteria bacterium]MBF0355320.1 hypothetical protein [Alphaproteobacteria bacterium]